jgi:hypothetical protein
MGQETKTDIMKLPGIPCIWSVPSVCQQRIKNLPRLYNKDHTSPQPAIWIQGSRSWL